MKHIFKIQIFLVLVFFCNTFIFASGSGKLLSPQNASELWSNNSLNSFSTGQTDHSTYYINQWDNSDILGDYFSGFYYNSLYWFFQLNWSSDVTKNVKVISSTDACNSWYGYKLGWFAKSETVGLIDFDYNNNVFVYYCVDDGLLHGKAYSDVIWSQSFEGLSFDILPEFTSSLLDASHDKIFVNNSTTIFSNLKITNKSTPQIAKKEAIDYGEESIFYIWKSKK